MAERLVIGCNYHTSWQKHKGMRFVLAEIKGTRARLYTRRTNREFWTDVVDLIFIPSKHNVDKANRLERERRYSRNIDDYITF